MKVKVIKKMMAYLLVGAMVISTPITASAAETSIADVYTETDDADKSSGTATLSGSATGTHKFEDEIAKKDVQVIGLALDKTSLSLEVNGGLQSDRLQARVLYSDYDPVDEEMVLKADQETKEIIDNYLHWEVIGNENRVVGISYYENAEGVKDHSMVNVKAKNGGNVTVRAFIDYNANGFLDGDEYYADATVSVKQLADSIKFSNLPDKFYLKQKYDLNKYITVEPATATTCNVSFYVGAADAKKVTISDDGVLTVKKVKDPETIKLYATTENGKQAETEITLHPGVPANKVIISSKKGDAKGVTLDFGKRKKEDMTTAELSVELQPKSGVTDKVTDSVEWSVKNPKTPVIEMTEIPSADDTRILNVQVKALSVGTATVTAKASSGKKGTYKITVDSTPYGVAITDIETWTGKKPALTAVLFADDYDKTTGTGTVIPVGKTKVTFAAPKKQDEDKASTNIKNIKVSAKGVVTSSNLLTDASRSKNPIKKDSRTINVTVKHAKDNALNASCVVTVNQADIQNITVTDVTHGAPGTPIVFDNRKGDAPSKPLSAVSGGKYQYEAHAFSDAACTISASEYDNAIVWASSSAKVGTITENGLFTALKGGSTKLTASYVTLTTKNNKTTAKLNKKTITVKPVQKATSLTLNKNVFVVVAGTNARDIAINVKKQLPSGSKDLITWKKVVGDSAGKTVEKSTNLTPTNAKTTAVKVPVASYSAGTVIKIGAYADGGAVAYAYIYVVDSKTKAVRATENGNAIAKNKMELKVGVDGQRTIAPQVQSSERGASFVATTEYVRENIGYVKDPVKYSFNKAGIASIDRNGVITGLKPGTTKLTIQTLSGKKSTVTITVK